MLVLEAPKGNVTKNHDRFNLKGMETNTFKVYGFCPGGRVCSILNASKANNALGPSRFFVLLLRHSGLPFWRDVFHVKNHQNRIRCNPRQGRSTHLIFIIGGN